VAHALQTSSGEMSGSLRHACGGRRRIVLISEPA
jgi:hypothetical protein